MYDYPELVNLILVSGTFESRQKRVADYPLTDALHTSKYFRDLGKGRQAAGKSDYIHALNRADRIVRDASWLIFMESDH